MKTRSVAVVSACGLAVASSLAGADVITDFNRLALQSISGSSTPPPMAARNLAMMHIAMYDAVNSIDRTHAQFYTSVSGASGASREAAAVTAAAAVMGSLYSSQAASFNAARDTVLAGIGDVAARNAGVAVGNATASATLAARMGDGSGVVLPPYTGNTGVGQWRPTNGAAGALPQWPSVTPFTMASQSQFRPAAPPALNSQAYADAYNEVKAYGSATSSVRTQEQTDIARVWKAGGGTVTPPGQWNQIATQITENLGLSISESARLFAQMNVSMADGGIAAWDCKYFYNTWRPITAIQEGASDGNDFTIADPGWQPLLTPTPNHPTYTSGHSTFSRSAATALQRFFGRDDIAFSLSNSVDAPGVTRFFTSLDAAANEAGQSRIYGGIHFQFDNTAGQECGMAIGNWVADRYFQAIPAPGAAGLMAMGGLLASRRRRR